MKGNWPEGVRPIPPDGMDRVGIDAEGRLHWDGKPMEIRKRVSLTFLQAIGAVVIVLSIAVVAVIELLVFLGYGPD